MNRFTFFLISIILLSCEKEDSKTLNGSYPKGMKVNDTQSINDCTLPECSDERVIRLIATNVKGKIVQDIFGQYVITYFFTFDSSINFYLCDLPEEFQEEGLEIVFDGNVIDACGVKEALFPIEEVYNLKLTKIRKF